MPKELTIAIEINDPRLARSITDEIEAIPDVKAIRWAEAENRTAPGRKPEIIIVDDNDENKTIYSRLTELRRQHPDTALFVISSDQRPGHIVEVMKMGVAEYLVAPIDPQAFKDAIEEIRIKLATAGKMAHGSVYSFVSSKGGLGSTVIAANVATALAKGRAGAVALFDMSFQSGDSSVLLDIVPETSLLDLCRNFHRLDISLLRGCLLRHDSGMDFLAAPLDPEESEEVHAEHIEKTFNLAKKLYDNILVDCTSMHIDENSAAVFRESNKIFIITDLSVPAIRNAARLFQMIQKMGIDPQHMEYVVNRYIKGGSLSIDEVERTLGKRIHWLFPNDFVDIVSSINRGIPLVKNQPNAPFSKSVAEFIDKLKDSGSSDGYRGVRGAFGKAI